MNNLIDFSGIDGLQRWLRLTYPNTNIGTEFTNYGSFMSAVPDLSSFEQLAKSASTDQEKDAVYSKALIEATRKAAPIAASALTSSREMVAKGLKWFDDQIQNNNQQFILWHKEYENLKKAAPTIDQLMAYQMSALNWRNATGYGVLEETATLKTKVVAQFSVPGIYVMTVQDMIKDMIARRGGGPRRGVSDDHIRCCLSIMNGNFSSIINPTWGEIDKKNLNGLLLLATGFAKLRELQGPGVMVKVQSTADKFREWSSNQNILEQQKAKEASDTLQKAINESLTLGTGAAVFKNQVAQIDSVFSSYYWIWRAGVNLESFPLLSDFLFELGQTARGNAKIVKALERTGLSWSRPLVSLFADKTFKLGRIHMHPAVLTTGRLNEMGACFGIIPATHPEAAVIGSGFAKNILNVRTDKLNPSAKLVVQLFDIQRHSRSLTDLDVVSSEHLLHQILVGKRTAYQNAFQVQGDATETRIVGFDPPRPTNRQSNIQSYQVGDAGVGQFAEPLYVMSREDATRSTEGRRIEKLTEIARGVEAWEESKRAEMVQKRGGLVGGPTVQTRAFTIQEQMVAPGSQVQMAPQQRTVQYTVQQPPNEIAWTQNQPMADIFSGDVTLNLPEFI
nr:N protein [Nairoviridae sp.]